MAAYCLGLSLVSDNITVRHDPNGHRFELYVGEQLAGFLAYSPRGDGVVVFTHTEVRPEFEERGFAGQLAKAALADARANNIKIVARCPFVASYIARHGTEYDDLVAP
jgi:uncharacterized protein